MAENAAHVSHRMFPEAVEYYSAVGRLVRVAYAVEIPRAARRAGPLDIDIVVVVVIVVV